MRKIKQMSLMTQFCLIIALTMLVTGVAIYEISGRLSRTTFTLSPSQDFDEGLLRRRSQFMWPGKLRHIRFEFSGPSAQAILDRLPTARIIDVKGKTYTMEAEVYGDGIKMYLLSQGSWVKVLAPQEFVDEMQLEIEKMRKLYR